MATTRIGRASKEFFLNTFCFFTVSFALLGTVLFISTIIAILMLGFLAQVIGPMVP